MPRPSPARRSARAPFAAASIVAATLAAAPALAQVSIAPFPTSHLDVSTGWSGWWPFNFPYGAGNPASGSSGVVNHGFAGPNLSSLTVEIHELRSSEVAPFPNAVIHSGEVFFTPGANLQYTLGGSVAMIVSGVAGSGGASGTLALDEVGGPTLASYSGSLTRTGATPVAGLIYDAASPIGGSQSGPLAAGSTYRLSWQFYTFTINGGDAAAFSNVDPGAISSFSIHFSDIPAPGVGGTLLIAAAAVSRRRRARPATGPAGA